MRKEKSHASRAASIFADIISNYQFHQIMTTAEADSSLHDMLDVVHVLANTGMRPGELINYVCAI
jgi:hypothetical protein